MNRVTWVVLGTLVWPACLFAGQAQRSPVRPAGTQPTATRPRAPATQARDIPGAAARAEPGPELDELIEMLLPPAPRRRRRVSPPARRWEDLPPHERRELMARYERFKKLPEHQQQELRNLWEQFRKMPARRRGRLTRLWHRVQEWLGKLSPEERAHFFRLSPPQRVMYIGSLARAGKLKGMGRRAPPAMPDELLHRIEPKLTFDEWADLACLAGTAQWELLHRLAQKYQVQLPADVPQPRAIRHRRQFARALRLFYETSSERFRRHIWELPPERQVHTLMHHYFPALRRFFHELPESERRALLGSRGRRWRETQQRLERLFIEHMRRRLADKPHPAPPEDVRPVKANAERR